MDHTISSVWQLSEEEIIREQCQAREEYIGILNGMNQQVKDLTQQLEEQDLKLEEKDQKLEEKDQKLEEQSILIQQLQKQLSSLTS